MKDRISGYIVFLDKMPRFIYEDLDEALAEYEKLYEEEQSKLFNGDKVRVEVCMYRVSNATLVQSDRTEPA